ncbi:MAG: hypothetical protein WC755_01420 [Candidatus Woesearchaeota archaeon]|jgi:hypothetical protein
MGFRGLNLFEKATLCLLLTAGISIGSIESLSKKDNVSIDEKVIKESSNEIFENTIYLEKEPTKDTNVRDTINVDELRKIYYSMSRTKFYVLESGQLIPLKRLKTEYVVKESFFKNHPNGSVAMVTAGDSNNIIIDVLNKNKKTYVGEEMTKKGVISIIYDVNSEDRKTIDVHYLPLIEKPTLVIK